VTGVKWLALHEQFPRVAGRPCSTSPPRAWTTPPRTSLRPHWHYVTCNSSTSPWLLSFAACAHTPSTRQARLDTK